MLAAGLRVQALIGSTMAECDPDFAGDLGADAVGIFASDRPTGGFQPGALQPSARATYERFAAAWATAYPPTSADDGYGAAPSAGSGSEYTISGPVEAGSAEAGPSEEGLSGFSAAWALFHDVLPSAAANGPLDADSIAAAARGVDLPTGSLPNGAGLAFSADPATLGQNVRAAAVIWQWQAVRSYTFVWPPTYATGNDRVRAVGSMIVAHPQSWPRLWPALLLLAVLAVAVVVRVVMNGPGVPSAFAAGATFGLALIVVAIRTGWRARRPSLGAIGIGVAGGVILVILPVLVRSTPGVPIGLHPEPFAIWVGITVIVAAGGGGHPSGDPVRRTDQDRGIANGDHRHEPRVCPDPRPAVRLARRAA